MRAQDAVPPQSHRLTYRFIVIGFQTPKAMQGEVDLRRQIARRRTSIEASSGVWRIGRHSGRRGPFKDGVEGGLCTLKVLKFTSP
jgi:hypothetical protein